MNDADNQPAVVGQVEPSVRPALPTPHLRAEALAVMNAGWERGGHVYSADQMRAYAAQVVAAKKPLTEWQIQELCCAVDASAERPAATALIRAVERAHGIGA